MKKIVAYSLKNRISWAFFDYFGTTVQRCCTPSEIKRFWAKSISLQLSRLVSSDTLYQVRLSAESFVGMHTQNGEIKFSEVSAEIYERIRLLCPEWNMAKEDFIALSFAVECDCEKKSQYVSVSVKQTMEDLKAANKKIAIVSDFYLGKEAFALFLEHHKIAHLVDEVFVSCDYGKNKYRGDLYDFVLSELNVSGKECIMTGDNKVSDIMRAGQKGIKAFLVKAQETNQKKALTKKLDSVYKLCHTGKERYANYVFLLYLFTERLYKNAQQANIKDLYFLSREGQFLKKLFDAYLENRNYKDIKTHYLYVSRKSTYPATLKPLDQEDFSLLQKYKSFRISDFLDNLGIDYATNMDVFEGFDLNEEIADFFTSGTFEKLKNRGAFKVLYNNFIADYKDLIKGYLKENGIAEDTSIAVVDVGWNGTMQNNLLKIFDDIRGVGFYIGTTPATVSRTGNEKRGLIFHAVPYKSKNYRNWSYDHVFLERILCADHGATEKYELRDGKVTPVIKVYNSEQTSYQTMLPVQQAILKKFMLIDQAFLPSAYDAEDFESIFLEKHTKTLFTVNNAQLQLQKEMIDNQMQNFGRIETAKDSLNTTFSKKNIIRKAFKRLHVLRNTEIVFRILQRYNFNLAIKILYLAKRQGELKKRR